MAVEVTGTGQDISIVGKAEAVDVVQPSYGAAVAAGELSVSVASTGWALCVDQAAGDVGVESGVMVSGIPYAGEYEADAMFSEQVFPTRMKTMADDFTVHAINYTEAPNGSGITLTIGG